MAGRFAFVRRQRLLKEAEYSAVFDARRSLRSRSFQVMILPNQLGYPRLGMVVAKRQLVRAVDRNYMRRIIRETFRLLSPLLPAADIVVRLHATPTKPREAASELAGILKKLAC